MLIYTFCWIVMIKNVWFLNTNLYKNKYIYPLRCLFFYLLKGYIDHSLILKIFKKPMLPLVFIHHQCRTKPERITIWDSVSTHNLNEQLFTWVLWVRPLLPSFSSFRCLPLNTSVMRTPVYLTVEWLRGGPLWHSYVVSVRSSSVSFGPQVSDTITHKMCLCPACIHILNDIL